VKITIPALNYHQGQLRLLRERKRFNVACMGRRFGKTLFGLEQILFEPNGALDGKPVAWFAPTYQLLLEVWKDAERSLKPVIRKANKTDNRIELITGGTVDFWTLQDENSGRGRKYTRIVIDEAAHARYLKDAWEKAIAPTLTDFQGEAWFISTPAGHNYFHHLFSQAGHTPDWQSWQLPTSVNPHIPPAEIDNMRALLPERVFRQEYLAEFIADGAGVFRGIDRAPECGWLDMGIHGDSYTIGVDWGRHNDFTAFMVINQRGQLVHMDRFTDIGYELQVGRLNGLWTRFNRCPILAESNSMGGPLIERLQRQGVSVKPFNTTNSSKAEAIEALALALENGQIAFPDDDRLDVLKRELIAYDQERLPSGQIRYGAPKGQHDDCVMSLAIAWSGAQRPALRIDVPTATTAHLTHW
jgi:hypothetical protein